MDNRPKVGVGVIVYKDKKVLLGKRKNAHGEGSWSFAGGHLEFGESIEACAKREVLEETGAIIKNIKIGPITNDIFEKENKHYITIFTLGEYETGDIKTMEPDKSEKRERFGWEDLPDNLFLPIQNLLKTKFSPFT